MEAELLQRIKQIPIVKLPPSRFIPVLETIGASQGSRNVAIQKILDLFGPRFDEKRSFRALVAPTLTRFHFARSSPPRFELAPNGVLTLELPTRARTAYVGLCLKDLAIHRLRLPVRLTSPDILRDEARKFGPTVLDQVSGLSRYLREFMGPPMQVPIQRWAYDVERNDFHLLPSATLDTTRTLVRSLLTKREIAALDVARLAIMRALRENGTAVSSFTVDLFIGDLIKEGRSCIPVVSGTNSLEAMIFSGRPYAAIRRGPGP